MEKKRLILWIAVILTLAFIFGQSLLSQEVSDRESNVVKEKVVQPIHEVVTGNSSLPHDIRDIAHIVEFLVLGLELLLLLKNKKIPIRLLRTISYCGFVALIDESIQYFSGRAPQVIDIWYDIFGAVAGVGIGVLLTACIGNIKSKKQTQRRSSN